jgi:hypothetical protein
MRSASFPRGGKRQKLGRDSNRGNRGWRSEHLQQLSVPWTLNPELEHETLNPKP